MGLDRTPLSRPAAIIPDLAVPIGAERRPPPPLVMRINGKRDDNGAVTGLFFVDEVPLSARFASKVVRYEHSSGVPPYVEQWFRLEYKTRSQADSPIGAGSELIITWLPLSNQHVDVTTFKLPQKDGTRCKAYIKKLLDDNPNPDSKTTIDYVEAYRNDFWERGDYLTAGLSKSSFPETCKTRENHGDDRVLGLCRDFDACYAGLLASPPLLKLADKVDEGALEIINGGRFEKVSLHPEIRNKADPFLALAAKQALSGPCEPKNGDWYGRPVHILAQHRFRNLVLAENRIISESRKKAGPSGAIHLPRLDGEHLSDRISFEEWALIDEDTPS